MRVLQHLGCGKGVLLDGVVCLSHSVSHGVLLSEDGVEDFKFMRVPGSFHALEQILKLSFVKNTILPCVKNCEELHDLVKLKIKMQEVCDEDEVFFGHFSVIADVQESEGLALAWEHNSNFLLDLNQ